MSIVWQQNAQLKIAKSTYTAAFIYATRICHRKQCSFCGNIFRNSSNPRILKRKVHEGNSVPFVELFSENPAISEYIKEKFMKAYCQRSEILSSEGDPIDPGENMMLKCNFIGMLKNVNCVAENCSDKDRQEHIYSCNHLCYQNLPPRTVCVLWKYFPKI